MSKYADLLKKYQDKIDKEQDAADSVKKKLDAAEKEVDFYDKNKKDVKKYDAKKHEAAKKNVINYAAVVKRHLREIKLLEDQLKNFKDGFEHNLGRQGNDKTVEEHAKGVFFEVQKFATGVGDTTKKLKAAFDECSTLYDRKFQELSDLTQQTAKVDDEDTMNKLKVKMDKLSPELALLGKKKKALEERYLYYKDKKEQLTKMLADGEIDDKEYKLYKSALQKELK